MSTEAAKQATPPPPPAQTEEELAAQRAAKKAADNKKKRERQKAKAKERAENRELFGVDPAVESLAGSFDKLGAHQFFSGNMKLAYNNIQGRYVVAAKDLPAGTLVLDQAPFAGVLFDAYAQVFCHHCFGACTGSVFQCADCKFARYCSKACFQAAEPVHMLECDALRDLPIIRLEGESAALRCVMRALCVGVKEERWAADQLKKPSQRDARLAAWKPRVGCNFADVEALMTHESNFPPAVVAQAKQVMSALGTLLPPNVWAATGAERAARLYLRYHVNAHSITDLNNNPIGMGIFSAASYLNHSCAPTCAYTFGGAGGSGGCNMTMRTVRAVKAGEELTHNYVDMYAPSWVRRAQLRGRYFFDPTAEGRHEATLQAKEDKQIGGLKCLRCGKGQLNFPELQRARAGAQRANPHNGVAGATDAGAETAAEAVAIDADAAAPEAETGAAALGLGPEATVEVAVGDDTLLQCGACGDASVTLAAAEAFVASAYTRLQQALGLLAAGQASRARESLEAEVVGLSTLPVVPAPEGGVIAAAPAAADGAPSRAVAALGPFHYVVFNAYTALMQIARGARDYKSLGKYGQLSAMALRSLQLDAYPAMAAALAACGDADAVAGGVPEGVMIEGKVEPAVLAACTGDAAKAPELAKKRKSARDAWSKAQHVYLCCYGDKSPLTAHMGRKLAALDKIIAALQ